MTADEIRAIRRSLYVSQEKFAQLLGTTVVTVNRWESGKVKPSRLYVKELKELKARYESHASRRKEHEDSGRLRDSSGNGTINAKDS